jgi:cytochrome P450
MELDPFDYGFHRDPYPTYEWLREHAPVYHNERIDFWALSRFDDVLAGLHDPDIYTSTGGVAIEHTDAALQSMIEMDPPEHTQMRKLIARRFTPRRIAELEPRVRDWTNTLLDSLAGRAEFDVVREFSALLPTTVVGTMLGIPPSRHDDARRWTDDLLTREPGNPVPPRAAAEGAMNIAVLAQQLSEARRAHPEDDLLSLLVAAELDGVPLTDEQVIGFCLLLISGGHETTSKLIANGVRLFATHPEQRDAVIANPALMPGAVEELLRYTSPTQYMARTVTRDVTLHDVVMPAGAKVVLLLGSGNRDRREFDRPDEFDVTRANPRILAFGHGAHVCLGAAVARLEARVALQEFLARYPEYLVDEDAVEFLHSGNVQGPTSVPVSILAGSRGSARGAGAAAGGA